MPPGALRDGPLWSAPVAWLHIDDAPKGTGEDLTMTVARGSIRRPFGALVGAVLILAGVLPGTAVPAAVAQTPIFINEIHYDNTGTDADEGIEIAGPAGTDLAGWSIVLYNGANGLVYDTDPLSGSIIDADGSGFGAASITYPENGIQNGAPDGIALLNGTTVVQFLSYEGTFTAVDGPAAGMLSTDIGVSETGSEPLGRSLQLVGTGTTYEDFTWQGPTGTASFGTVNAGQTFASVARHLMINEFVANHTGTDTNEYVEVRGDPATDYSAYSILHIEGDGTGAGVIDTVIPVGTTGTTGHWVTGFLNNALENGTISLLLVKEFSGAAGNDLDTDNDGVLDGTPWSEVTDGVAVSDGGAGDRTYTATVLAPGFGGSAFTPGGASRIPDGIDTDAVADWTVNDFDLAGIPGFAGTPVVGEALNTPGAPNELYVPPVTGNCGDAATFIHDIQGSGPTSPLVGTQVFIESVVVGDFQNNGESDDGDLDGFYVQEEDADADAATSEGIFIFTPGAADVAVGDLVRVVGTVTEFSTSGGASQMTELGGVGGVLLCQSGTPLPAATTVTLPVTAVTDFERYEGMRVTFPQALAISEFFNFDRFNEIVLTVDRQHQPTAVAEPGSPEADAVAGANRLGRITLDDGRSAQNLDPAIHPNAGVFDLTNRFRGGDTVENATGVIDESFGLYRIQPTRGADYAVENPRPEEPEDVGGSLQVASFNVLNYFTTIDTGADICGPDEDQECRGADTPEELARQRTKIIAALSAIDADVVGLIEIENHPGDVPTADLVSGLNDVMGAGTYAYISTGAIGSDAIRVALIYKPAAVTPAGGFEVLDSTDDARFLDAFNRPVLAQTFDENATGARFTVAVNHLKSKGSDCNAIGDPDTGDGQGNCNLTREAAAEALVDWLAGDPTGSGDRDVLIMGDLNSYDKEDPIDAVRAGADDIAGSADDYTDLIFEHQGELAYSYLFDGQLGYLDHALGSPTVTAQVTGTTVWHINADEPDILDYDMTFKQDAQDALYEPNAYRSSDHDPVIVGLDLRAPYDFDGFYRPIVSPPDTNTAKAGSRIPLKFSLGGDFGLDVLFGTPQVFQCADWPTGSSVDASSTPLSYDALIDEYKLEWKTRKSWADSCRTIELLFDDGTYRTVSVDLK